MGVDWELGSTFYCSSADAGETGESGFGGGAGGGGAWDKLAGEDKGPR